MSSFTTKLVGVLVLVVCSVFSVGLGQDFAGGTGDPNDPYQIATVEHLISLASDPNLYDEYYVLTADIDLGGQIYAAAVIAPDLNAFDFVYDGSPFSGTFDGAGHKITNLTIDVGVPANGVDYLGLFGAVAEGSVIKNLELSDVSIRGGINSDYLGALSGRADSAVIDNCGTTGVVTSGLNCQFIGGLIGACGETTIGHCRSKCTVGGAENSSTLGGLVGSVHAGTLLDCEAKASVQGGTQAVAVGGLMGNGFDVTISNCRSDSTVSGGMGASSIGGLVGLGSLVTLRDCDFVGAVSAESLSYYLGGLVGFVQTGTVTGCHSDALVEGDSESYEVGGLIGRGADVTLTGCYSTGSVSGGINADYLGGLVGLLRGSIDRAMEETKIVDCHSECRVAGRDNSDHVGGLVGHNATAGKIYRSHASGAVHGEEEVGGLAGWNDGIIVDSHATGAITGAIDADRLGGLVGRNASQLHACYATGSVTGDYNSDHLGGLAGKNEYLISDCYATGAVFGGLEAEELGGLVGFNANSSTLIRRCYSTGAVTSLSAADSIGGFVGYHRNGRISQCFWDMDASGMLEGIGVLGDRQDGDDVVGLTTLEMQDPGSFAVWDFAGPANTGLSHQWAMAQGDPAPLLWWQRASAVALPTFAGGSGTEADPYVIADLTDLNSIGYNPRLLDKHYRLVADIALAADQELKMIGNDLHPFTGTFDGEGHAIGPVTVLNAAAYEDLWGAFGYLGPGGQIRNLSLSVELSPTNRWSTAVAGLVSCARQATIAGCHVTGSVSSGYDYTAGLVGVARDCQISNSSASTEVSGRQCVGGLVGYLQNGLLTSSFSAGGVSGDVRATGGLVGRTVGSEVTRCFSTVAVSGDYSVGGAIGEGQSSRISFTYSTGSVDGTNHVGGFGGDLHDGHVHHCYSTGAVSGTMFWIGGFAGILRSELAGCFWDIETSGQTQSDGGLGLTTAQMQSVDTYLQAGWDFVDETENGTEDIWVMTETDYPHLAWELRN